MPLENCPRPALPTPPGQGLRSAPTKTPATSALRPGRPTQPAPDPVHNPVCINPPPSTPPIVCAPEQGPRDELKEDFLTIASSFCKQYHLSPNLIMCRFNVFFPYRFATTKIRKKHSKIHQTTTLHFKRLELISPRIHLLQSTSKAFRENTSKCKYWHILESLGCSHFRSSHNHLISLASCWDTLSLDASRLSSEHSLKSLHPASIRKGKPQSGTQDVDIFKCIVYAII